jgi:hypothetical protein
MSVTSTDNQVIYTGSGTTGPFDFDFKVFETSELKIEKFTIATETSVTLTETTDYSVALDGDGTGAVTLVAVLSSAYKLIITRELPLTQEVAYVEGDKFPATTHEEALDRAAMRDQQLQEQLDRCVKVTAGSSTTPDELIDSLETAVAGAVAAKTAAETAETNAELAETNAEAAQAAAEAAAALVPSFVRGTFVDGDLSTGKLTVTHTKGLAAPYSCWVEVINGSAQKVIPDQITFATNSFEIDLTSFGTITGTYGYTYAA